MLTREDKEKIARASDDAELLETLITLTTFGAHDRYRCERPDRDELVERFSVTRTEIMNRMGAANASKRG